MSRENLKLISVRIDPETLEKIEKFVADRRYWSRNAVINSILCAVADCMDSNSLYDMVRYSRYHKQDVECKFEIKRKTT